MTFNIFDKSFSQNDQSNNRPDFNSQDIKKAENSPSNLDGVRRDQENSTNEVASTILNSAQSINCAIRENRLPSSNLAKRVKRNEELPISASETTFPPLKKKKLGEANSYPDLPVHYSNGEILVQETTSLSIQVLTDIIRKDPNLTSIRMANFSSLICENQREFDDFMSAVYECKNLIVLEISLKKCEETITLSINSINNLVRGCEDLKSIRFEGIKITEQATEIFKRLLVNLSLDSLTIRKAGLEKIQLGHSSTLKRLDLSDNPYLNFPLENLQHFVKLNSLNLNNTFQNQLDLNNWELIDSFSLAQYLGELEFPRPISLDTNFPFAKILNALKNLAELFLNDTAIIPLSQIAMSSLATSLKKLVISESCLDKDHSDFISFSNCKIEELFLSLDYLDPNSNGPFLAENGEDYKVIAALPKSLNLLEIRNLKIDKRVWEALSKTTCSHLVLTDPIFLQDLTTEDEINSSITTLQLNEENKNILITSAKNSCLISLFPQLETLIFSYSADQLSLEQKIAILNARCLKKIVFNCHDPLDIQHYEGERLNSWRNELAYIELEGLLIPNLFLLKRDPSPSISEESIVNCLSHHSLTIGQLLILEKYADTYNYRELTDKLRERVRSLSPTQKNQLLRTLQPPYSELFKLLEQEMPSPVDWGSTNVSLENFNSILPYLDLYSPEAINYFKKIHWVSEGGEVFCNPLIRRKMVLLFEYFETERLTDKVAHFIDLFRQNIEADLGENYSQQDQLNLCNNFKALCQQSIANAEELKFFEYFFYQGLIKYNQDKGNPIDRVFTLFISAPALNQKTLLLYKDLDLPVLAPFCANQAHFDFIKSQDPNMIDELFSPLFVQFNPLNILIRAQNAPCFIFFADRYPFLLNRICNTTKSLPLQALLSSVPFNEVQSYRKMTPGKEIVGPFLSYLLKLKIILIETTSSDLMEIEEEKEKFGQERVLKISPDWFPKLICLTLCYFPHRRFVIEMIEGGISLKSLPSNIVERIFNAFSENDPEDVPILLKEFPDFPVSSLSPRTVSGILKKLINKGDLITIESLIRKLQTESLNITIGLNLKDAFYESFLADPSSSFYLARLNRIIPLNRFSKLSKFQICGILKELAKTENRETMRGLIAELFAMNVSRRLDLDSPYILSPYLETMEEAYNSFFSTPLVSESNRLEKLKLKFHEKLDLGIMEKVYTLFFSEALLLPYLADLIKAVPFANFSPVNLKKIFVQLVLLPNSLEIIHHLITNGVSFNIADVDGNKILHLLIGLTRPTNQFATFLKIAELLGSKENHTFNKLGLSPLFIACLQWQNSGCVQQFIRYVPDLNQKNSAGKNALYYANRNKWQTYNISEFQKLICLFSHQSFILSNRGCFPGDRTDRIVDLSDGLLPLELSRFKNQLDLKGFSPHWAHIEACALDTDKCLDLLKHYLAQGQVENFVRVARIILNKTRGDQHSVLSDDKFYQLFNLVVDKENLDFKKIQSYLLFPPNLRTVCKPLKSLDTPPAPQNYFNPVTLNLETLASDNFSTFYTTLEEYLNNYKYPERTDLLSNLSLFYQKINNELMENSKLESSSSSIKNIFNHLINTLLLPENYHEIVAYTKLMVETSLSSCPIVCEKELCGYLQLLHNPALRYLLNIFKSNYDNISLSRLTQSHRLVQGFDRIMHHKLYAGTPKVMNKDDITEAEQNSLDEFYKPIKNNFNHMIQLIGASKDDKDRMGYITLILESFEYCATQLNADLSQWVNTFIFQSSSTDFEYLLFSMLHSLKVSIINEMAISLSDTVHDTNQMMNLIGQKIGLDSGVEDPTTDNHQETNKNLGEKCLTIFFQNLHTPRIAIELHHLINSLNSVERDMMCNFLNLNIVPHFNKAKYDRLIKIANSLDKKLSINTGDKQFFEAEVEKTGELPYLECVSYAQRSEFYTALAADLDDKEEMMNKQEVYKLILLHFNIIQSIYDNLE